MGLASCLLFNCDAKIILKLNDKICSNQESCFHVWVIRRLNMSGNHKHFTLERTINRRVVGHVLQISAVMVSWKEHQAYFSISANLFVEKREGCRSELELISWAQLTNAMPGVAALCKWESGETNLLSQFLLQIMSRRMRVLLAAAAAAAARRSCALLSLHCVCHLTSRGKEHWNKKSNCVFYHHLHCNYAIWYPERWDEVCSNMESKLEFCSCAHCNWIGISYVLLDEMLWHVYALQSNCICYVLLGEMRWNVQAQCIWWTPIRM